MVSYFITPNYVVFFIAIRDATYAQPFSPTPHNKNLPFGQEGKQLAGSVERIQAKG